MNTTNRPVLMTNHVSIANNRARHTGASVAVAAMLLWTAPAAAQGDIELEPVEGPPAAQANDQTQVMTAASTFEISEFSLRYRVEHPQHIPISEIMSMPIALDGSSGTYMPALAAESDDDEQAMLVTLDSLNAAGTQTYSAAALQAIIETIRDRFVEAGYLGVFVGPDPSIVTPAGAVSRPEGMTEFPLLIATGIVTEMRTLASGGRVVQPGEDLKFPASTLRAIDDAISAPKIKIEERTNHPLHQKILRDSPVRPYDPTSTEPRGDLLNKAKLDRFVFHKGRHPGRRVDVALATAEDPQTVALDYIITENDPLIIYGQIGNTGTSQTGHLRERVGLIHSQVTNNDDIFSVELATNEFDGSNSVVTSYEAPFANDRIRWKIFGSWSEFAADQVGFFTATFTGTTWTVGGEIEANIWQNREQFLDLFASLTYYDIEVNNPLATNGQEQFLIPRFGVRYDRTTEWYGTQAEAFFEYGSLTDLNATQLASLGRTAPDDEWFKFGWSGQHSVFLEPLLNREAWLDPNTPDSSTLAHELLFRTSGQVVFGDNRVVPQFESVAGGLYTVRGYPESAVAGDNVVIGSAEYRFHLPRTFQIETEPRTLLGETFRNSPQFVYGRPDWDLIFKGFVDIGHVTANDALAFENDETLLGAGVGIELQYRRNVNLRLDWGFVLDEVIAVGANDGANRLHFVGTILF